MPLISIKTQPNLETEQVSLNIENIKETRDFVYTSLIILDYIIATHKELEYIVTNIEERVKEYGIDVPDTNPISNVALRLAQVSLVNNEQFFLPTASQITIEMEAGYSGVITLDENSTIMFEVSCEQDQSLIEQLFLTLINLFVYYAVQDMYLAIEDNVKKFYNTEVIEDLEIPTRLVLQVVDGFGEYLSKTIVDREEYADLQNFMFICFLQYFDKTEEIKTSDEEKEAIKALGGKWYGKKY